MSSAPRQTSPSMSRVVSPASSSALLMASWRRPSELTPLKCPSLLLPVPTMAYLSRRCDINAPPSTPADRNVGINGSDVQIDASSIRLTATLVVTVHHLAQEFRCC